MENYSKNNKTNLFNELEKAYKYIDEKYKECEEPWVECSLMYKKLKKIKQRNILNRRYIDNCLDKLDEYEDMANYYEYEELKDLINKIYYRIGCIFSYR